MARLFREIAENPEALTGYMLALADVVSGVVPMDADFILILGNDGLEVEPQYVSNIPRSDVQRSIAMLRRLADRLERNRTSGGKG